VAEPKQTVVFYARVHVGKDGIITVLTGKVEMGQGARTELTQAAAEELRVPISQVQMLMADTSIVPDDGTPLEAAPPRHCPGGASRRRRRTATPGASRLPPLGS